MAPAVIQTQPSSSTKISKPSTSPVVAGLLNNVDQVRLLLLYISPDLDYDFTPAPAPAAITAPTYPPVLTIAPTPTKTCFFPFSYC